MTRNYADTYLHLFWVLKLCQLINNALKLKVDGLSFGSSVHSAPPRLLLFGSAEEKAPLGGKGLMLRVSSVYHLLLAMSDAPEGFDEKSHHKHLKLSILSSLIVLNLLSNLCSILAILRRKQGKLTRMYFFLLHLSIADILVAFSSLLPDLILTSVGGSHFPGGNAMCKTVKFIQMFGPYLRYIFF